MARAVPTREGGADAVRVAPNSRAWRTTTRGTRSPSGPPSRRPTRPRSPTARAARRRVRCCSVADLGAADGVNSLRPHPRPEGRARRPAAGLRARRSPDERVGASPPATCRHAFGGAADGSGRPSSSRGPAAAARGSADVGSGRPLPVARGPRPRLPPRARAGGPPPPVGGQHGRHPPPAGALPPPGARVHLAVTRHGDALGRGRGGPCRRRGSVFPGYPDHEDEAERQRVARAPPPGTGSACSTCARSRLRPRRALHRRGPRLPGPGPRDRSGALRRGHRRHEPAARRLAPRRAASVAATVAAVVVPVWMRTLDGDPGPLRGPRRAASAGLELESAELFRLDNPYRHDDPCRLRSGPTSAASPRGAGRSSSAAFAPRGRPGARTRPPRRLPGGARPARRRR